MISKKLVIYTDGASRGNPGPAAIGVVLQDENRNTVATISQCLGNATNNQAEYRAIIAGLEKALALGATHIELRSDSELVVHQLSGKYKVKNEALKPLFQNAEELRRRLSALEVNYIPREKNTEADKLANKALDGDRNQKILKQSLTVNVRRATKDDYPPMLGIFMEMEKQHVEGVPEFFRPMSHEEQIKEFDSILADENATVMVAERDGEVLGYIQLALRESEVNPMLCPRRYVKISDLGVVRRFQRNGAGSALMAAAERWAAERGVPAIDLNVWEFNHGALTFYEKMGYKTANRHMWKHI